MSSPSDSQPPLPRRPDDPERLARLRKEASERLDSERFDNERPRPPAAVYGGPPNPYASPLYEAPRPPAPVYGGAPPARRRMIAGIVALLLGGLAAVASIFKDKWMKSRIVGPVYGGPPLPTPEPSKNKIPEPAPGTKPDAVDAQPRPAAAVYGGPTMRVEPPSETPSPPAPVYGGPPPPPPGKP